MNEIIQPSKGTVYYERKINSEARGGVKFENEIAGIYVQFDMTADPAQTQRNIDGAMNQAKATVFEQLGIPMAIDAQGLVTEAVTQAVSVAPAPAPVAVAVPSPVEQVVQAFPGATVEQNVAPVSAAPSVADAPPFPVTTADKAQKSANTAWAKARLQTHPHEFWDNRPKKASGEWSAKAPDFKHKDIDLAVWLS